MKLLRYLAALSLLIAFPAHALLHGSAGGGSPVTTLTVTDPSANKVFQRSAGQTTGPVALSGTYSGGTLTGVQGQVVNAVGGAVVLAWASMTCPTIAGGNWTCSLAGVPDGGGYNIQVRAANATSVTASGAHSWYMGMVFALDGQSNMDGCSSTSSGSTPASVAGTFFFDGISSWAAPPVADCIVNFLNGIKNTSGIPVAAFSVSTAGATSGFLASDSGGGLDTIFYPAMTAGGITDIEAILWNQGEGDANTSYPTWARVHDSNLELVHSKVAAHLGTRTMAQMPFVISSMTTFGSTGSGNTDATWATIRSAQRFAQTVNTNTTFSHSNMDGVRQAADPYHLDGASQGRNGQRFAQTINSLLGFGGAAANFSISGGAVVDATHTTVTIGLTGTATDFTPTSGITGFQVTGNNGATYVTPSAAVRTNATTITLTHASLATTNARKLNYQYGMLPDVSAPVKDNSTLAIPLSYTTVPDEISPTPLTTIARPDYTATAYDDSQTGTVQSNAGVPIGPAASRRLVIVGLAGSTAGYASLTIAPNVGTTKTATLIATAGQPTALAYALLDADADTATTVTLTVTYSSSPFSRTQMDVWTIPSAQLVSTTPSATLTPATTSSVTSVTSNIATPANGVVIAYAQGSTGTPGSISGTEAFANRDSTTQFIPVAGADACATASSASNPVTATFTASGNITLVAAVWH